VADSVTTDEDASILVDVLANDTDSDDDPLTVNSVVDPVHGTAVMTAGGASVVYTPDHNFAGSDTFSYSIQDGRGGMAFAAVTVTVVAVNDPPAAVSQVATTIEDAAVAIVLEATDVDGDAAVYDIVQPAHGSLSGTAPALTYTPHANFNGSDSFTFTAGDGQLVSAVATVSITVTPVNDGPVAQPQRVSTAEDTPIEIPLQATDVDDPELSFSVALGALHGTVTIAGDTATYRPNADYFGSDVFSIQASDGTIADGALIEVTVTAVNDAPVLSGGSFRTDEDVAVATPLTATDVESDRLTIQVVAPPSHGTVSGSTAQTLVYTPATNYFGVDSFTVKANDGTADSNVATVSIEVNAVNEAPVAAPQDVRISEDTSTPILLTATDHDGEAAALAFSVASGPSHGELSGAAPALAYTPHANFHGDDSFTFTVSDGTLSSTATISIGVYPVNDTPVAVGQTVNTDEDVQATIELSGIDVDGDDLTFEVISSPAHGSVVRSGSIVTYVPSEDFSGVDAFTFAASDGALSSTATVSLEVATVNDGPVADPQTVTTDEDTPVAVALNATDVDSSTLAFTVASQPENGVVSGDAPYLFYTPDANFFGADSFTFTVSDGTVSITETVSIDVRALNDAPVADAQRVATGEDVPLGIVLSARDVDSVTLTFSRATEPANGTLSGEPPNLTYTPNTDFVGVDSFTFTASDGTLSSTETVSIAVNATNDGPSAEAQSVSTSEDVALAIVLRASDIDSSALTFVVTAPPGNGTLTGEAPNLLYTPNAHFVGVDSLTFTANDGTLSSSSTVSIVVDPVNDAPVVVNPGTQQGFVGVPAELTIAATDIEGDSLSYSAAGLPSGMVLNATTGVISGTFTAAGTFTVAVQVSDGFVATTESFAWTVGDKPVLANPGPQVGRERDRVRLPMETTLPRQSRGARRTFTAVQLPRGLQIDSRDGEIKGRIERGAAGTYATRVSVTVGTQTYTVDFPWTVLPATGGSSGPGGDDRDDGDDRD
jgi:VCBS repeat-containing protein